MNGVVVCVWVTGPMGSEPGGVDLVSEIQNNCIGKIRELLTQS
jgi:hypothetical protein